MLGHDMIEVMVKLYIELETLLREVLVIIYGLVYSNSHKL